MGRERIFDAALAWRLVPIDADLVIATNFPSYFVRHRARSSGCCTSTAVAYDGAGEPWRDFGLDDEALEAQRLLTEWDTPALTEATASSPARGVVADRLARYNGLDAEPLYHPPPLHDRLHPGPFGDYVFSATRLEHNKRPELLVEATAASAAVTSASRIAGRGQPRTTSCSRWCERHGLTRPASSCSASSSDDDARPSVRRGARRRVRAARRGLRLRHARRRSRPASR